VQVPRIYLFSVSTKAWPWNLWKERRGKAEA
jgi:hypothetical protein